MNINAAEFKAKCLKLIDEVAATHEPLIISKRGKPLVKLRPIENEVPASMFGYMKGRSRSTSTSSRRWTKPGLQKPAMMTPSMPISNPREVADMGGLLKQKPGGGAPPAPGDYHQGQAHRQIHSGRFM